MIMKLLNKKTRNILLISSSILIVSCMDLSSITQTEFLTITSEHLAMTEDKEEENNQIIDTLEINKMLLQKTTNKIWEFNHFDVATPINFALREETSGAFKIDLGNLVIDSDDPDFYRIEIEDINVEGMVFQDYANFFYMPVNNSSVITIQSIIQHLQSSIDKKKIFYTDNKSFVIYGDTRNFDVIHLNYLEALKKMEIFVSYQTSGPFSDLSSRDLFSLALTKLRMAVNFHNIKSIDDEENWNHILSTMPRYHRKLANTTFEIIKKIPESILNEKKVEITIPDFDISIDIHRGKKVDTVQQDFKFFDTSSELNLETHDSLQNATLRFLKSTFTGSELNVLQKDKSIFLITDGQIKRIVRFYKTDNQAMLISVSDDYENLDLDDNIDIYFKLFKKIESGIDAFY